MTPSATPSSSPSSNPLVALPSAPSSGPSPYSQSSEPSVKLSSMPSSVCPHTIAPTHGPIRKPTRPPTLRPSSFPVSALLSKTPSTEPSVNASDTLSDKSATMSPSSAISFTGMPTFGLTQQSKSQANAASARVSDTQVVYITVGGVFVLLAVVVCSYLVKKQRDLSREHSDSDVEVANQIELWRLKNTGDISVRGNRPKTKAETRVTYSQMYDELSSGNVPVKINPLNSPDTIDMLKPSASKRVQKALKLQHEESALPRDNPLYLIGEGVKRKKKKTSRRGADNL